MTAAPFLEALRGGADRLPPGRRRSADEATRAVHRRRLVAGMAQAGAAKGYASVTVADIVAQARVSRRTFYEHFADMEACLLATYEECTRLHCARIAAAVDDPERSFEQHVQDGIAAFVEPIATSPALAKLFVIDLLSAGSRALEARRRVHRRYARLVVALVERHGREPRPDGRRLDPLLAAAFVGAVNEIVFLAVEGTADATLDALRNAVNDVFHAITALGGLAAAGAARDADADADADAATRPR